MQGGQDRDIWGKLEEFCKNLLLNLMLIAVYPRTIELEPEPGRTVNMINNLELFRNSLVASFREVLNGGKKATLIRIAHVGASTEDPFVGTCEKVLEKHEDACIFIPISSCEATFLRHLAKNMPTPIIVNNKPLEGLLCLHADPLIYAVKGGRLILSLTYGEDDAEPKYIWYNFVKEKKWGWNTSNVDAYVLFNSSFIVKDDIDIQLIHGGFKAVMWNPLGCFKDSRNYCLQFQVDEHQRSRILERVQVNPHWIRGDYENEDVSDFRGYILMIVGDDKIEDDKSSWFFSLPIAPHILYPYVYCRSKEEKKEKEYCKSEKLDLAVDIIRSRLGTENGIRERVGGVVELLESDIKGDEEREHLEQVRSVLEDMLRSYASGTLSPQVESWLGECEKSVKDKKRAALLRLFKEGGIIPKYWFDKERKEHTINASYLDIAIMHPSNYKRRDLGILAWAFGLALIVLIDSYIEFVK